MGLGRMRKNIYDLLKICNKNSEKILPTKEVLKLFGYSKNTNLNETKAMYLIYSAGIASGSGQASLWKIGNWSILNRHEMCEVLGNEYWMLKQRQLTVDKFLCPKDKIPWWRLKEYGGKL